MKEKKSASSASPEKAKKRNLYLILITACALILAAAIAFTVVVVTRDNGVTLEEPDDPDDPDKPTDTDSVFSLPMENATIGTTFTFYYNSTLDRYHLHQGIDFKADAGTLVTAANDGTVKSISDTILEGGCIVIEHENGIETVYASVDALSTLKVGDKVSRGDKIATVSAAADVMGNEYNEGTHLHFEMRENGKAVDPAEYLDTDDK